FVIMPNDNSIGKKLKGEDWFAYHDKTHISLLPVAKWKQLITNNNFRITKIGGDGLWDTPYMKYMPHFLQKLFFYPPAFIQIITQSLFIPLSWGEDLIIFARKGK
ncbi:hypothetical protein KC909_04545, partial [Candidatus Dojkabacteria bacterium]|nr:hypothetical protein [Candidatus Dojkabacteria bacterium]